jgi:hypothetical protein
MHEPAPNTITARHTLRIFVTSTVLLLMSCAGAHGQSKTLPANTRFFVPVPPNGAVQQVESLLKQRQLKNALLITAMETVPQAVWLTSGTPSQVSATVTSTLRQANAERAVPVLVLYNIPGRDCGSYSAGGAENTADYEAWIDAIAGAIGSQKVAIVLEPDAVADLPSTTRWRATDRLASSRRLVRSLRFGVDLFRNDAQLLIRVLLFSRVSSRKVATSECPGSWSWSCPMRSFMNACLYCPRLSRNSVYSV